MRNGIYQIRNLTNDKCYIGSASASGGIPGRWSDHRRSLACRKHHSIKLQRAWDKYGVDAFVFEILLYCDPENCLMYEQIALNHHKPDYNICTIAGGSPMVGRKHSSKTIAKMKEIKIGKVASEETKIKMSDAHTGKKNAFWNRHHLQSSKEKISRTKSKLTKEQKQEVKLLITQGVPQIEIAKRFGVCPATITNIKIGRSRFSVSVDIHNQQ